MWQGPRLGFVAETGRLLLWRRLEYDFVACFCALLPTFRFSFFLFFLFLFFFLHPGMFIFSMSLRLCSSHLILSASTYFIVGLLLFLLLVSFVPYPTSEFFCFLYSSSIFFFQAEDGIRDPLWSRGLGDVYKRQILSLLSSATVSSVTAAAVDPPRPRTNQWKPKQTAWTRGLQQLRFHLLVEPVPVSYTHLTLPTICSV